jgi:hypothetical protein
MNKVCLYFLLLGLPVLAFGQNRGLAKKYKYSYHFLLKPQVSTYSFDSVQRTERNGKVHVTVIVTEKGCKEISSSKDITCTTYKSGFLKQRDSSSLHLSQQEIKYQLQTDGEGKAELEVDTGGARINIRSIFETPVEIENFLPSGDYDYRLNVEMGSSNFGAIANMNCKSPVSAAELEKLLNDLSEKRVNNLPEKKECYILWEI